MTGIFQKAKSRLIRYLQKEKSSVSGGTVLFIIFTFLLIVGGCKFSLYVLKNHKSAAERNALIRTYIDVQPYNNGSKRLPYLSADKRGNPAPAFLPIRNRNDFSRTSSTVSSGNDEREEKNAPANSDKNESSAKSLDSLMSSGLTLWGETEEKIASSELLLHEPSPSAAENVKKEVLPKGISLPYIKKDSPAPSITPLKKEITDGTRWLDANALRRQLQLHESETSVDKTNKIEPAPLLPKEENVNTVVPNTLKQPEPDKTVALAPKKPTVEEKQVVNVKEPIRSSSPVSLPEPEKKPAVIADTSSTGTLTPEKAIGEKDIRSLSARQRRIIDGNSPDLWSVAKTKDSSENDVKKKQKSAPIEETKTKISEKGTENKEKKPLDWMDRQNAAVWTSMSQSDIPSVWSSGSQTSSLEKDRAKAFRIAEEIPEEKPQNTKAADSPSVRIVGEETPPEGKENPVLLPLGQPAVTDRASRLRQRQNDTSSSPAAPVLPPVQNVSPSVAPDAQPQVPPQIQPQPAASESGIMDKIFSIFNKPEASASVPSIGSGIPVPAETPQTPAKKEAGSAPQTTPTPVIAPSASPIAVPPVKKQEEKIVIPTELRLTFKPNSAELSAQSIKWIKAFGQRAKKDIQNAVEIRMSTTDSDLQKKRFSLIRNILTGTGVEEAQIIPVITDRTPHTIVLRMLALPEEGLTEYTTENNGIREQLYYKQW